MRGYLVIVAGGVLTGLITASGFEWAAPVAYGVGIFLGRVTSRAEVIDLIERVRRG